MESHLESIERNYEVLDQKMTTVTSELANTKQQLEEIKSLLHAVLKGKSTADTPSANAPTAELALPSLASIFDGNPSSSQTVSKPPSRSITLDYILLSSKKIELPTFQDIVLLSWVRWAEQYFQVQNTPEELKVMLALVSMEGHALHWMTWLRDCKQHLTWDDVKT